MNRKYIFRVLTVVLLVSADQLSKLAATLLIGDSTRELVQLRLSDGWFVFHVHPDLNVRDSVLISVLLAIVMFALLASVIFCARRARAYALEGISGADGVKSCPRFTNAAICLLFAGVVSSMLFDAFLWGGSLDFICFERYKYLTEGGVQYTDVYRFDIDLKDIYLIVGGIMLLVRCALWDISVLKLPKEERKLVSKRLRDPVGLIRSARSESRSEEPENGFSFSVGSVIDLISTIVSGILASAYFIFTFVLLPVAAEYIAPLGSFLNDIGRKYDAETVYRTIQEAITLLAIFPAHYGANASAKRLEKAFIRNTEGRLLPGEGLAYRLRHNLLFDILTVAGVALIGFGLSAAQVKIPYLCLPFDLICRNFGVARGIAAALIITAAAQVFGALKAQRYWSAAYLFSD